MEQFEKVFNEAKDAVGTDNIEAFAREMYQAGRAAMLRETRAMLHTVKDSPGKRYVYEFYKYPGHDTLSASMCRYLSSGVHIAEVVRKNDQDEGLRYLPVAWCDANGLMKLLGYNKTFEEKAREQAWAWYSDEQNCGSCKFFFNQHSGNFGVCRKRGIEIRRDRWCAKYKLEDRAENE